MMTISKGNLVYVPSKVELYKFNESVDIGPQYFGFKQVEILEKPMNLLLLESTSDNKFVKVWYDGEEWFVDKRDIRDL